ncbi:transposase [Cohaesibacter haloalkalitolerans]|uniref:transposase n=1 Tax=Cohaesibacter haloalkalitolerans TaxID=1162980 RepID=UPI000E652D5B
MTSGNHTTANIARGFCGSPAHRAAASLVKGGFSRHIGRAKGGLDTKLHAVCDGKGRPVALYLIAGLVSDHIGAKILYPVLPDGNYAIEVEDKGYDSDEYRAALPAKGITFCIPPRKGRKAPASFCKAHYKCKRISRSYLNHPARRSRNHSRCCKLRWR